MMRDSRARRTRAGIRVRAALFGAVVVVTAALAGASAASSAPASGASWSSLFDAVRPVPIVSSRQFIVGFTDPSLGEWQSNQSTAPTAAEQRAFMARITRRQQRVLDAMRRAGIAFDVRHSYLRVFNGVSIVVHGDSSELIAGVPGVASVSNVRAVYPASYDTAFGASVTQQAAAADAPVVDESATSSSTASAASSTAHVVVLDTGIDFNHPALTASHGGPGIDVLSGQIGVDPGAHDQHGTEVASAIVSASDGAARIESYRVLDSRPVLGGVEAVVGTSDDLLAGMERAVDPNQDGVSSDAADVMVIALAEPYAGFRGMPEDQAVSAAQNLGVVTVAAAGNDGASGDSTGTVGGPGSARDALTVGASDQRFATHHAAIHIRGGVVDTEFADAPIMTASSKLPDERVDIIPVPGRADDPVAYLGSDLRSRVSGALALVERQSGVSVATQIRAAADSGALGVIIGNAEDVSLAGVVDAPGVSIAAIGIPAELSATIRDAADADRVTADIAVRTELNAARNTVAAFSSTGPRHDGRGKPDVVAAGVAVSAATTGRSGGREQYVSVTGTSIAAGTVAGAVAAVRADHPEWSAQMVRSAVIGTARPLGDAGSRPSVIAQGSGMIDREAASRTSRVAQPARLDFGIMTPGASMVQPIAFISTRSGTQYQLPTLQLERQQQVGPVPRVDGDAIAVDVPVGTTPGVYGGWIIDATHGVRIPWVVVVQASASISVPMRATLRDPQPRPSVAAGGRVGTLEIGIGGTPMDGSLGITGVQQLEILMRREDGTMVGTVGAVRWALPGVYSFGITGVDPKGGHLAPGTYDLAIRYVSSISPDTVWIDGPTARFTIAAP